MLVSDLINEVRDLMLDTQEPLLWTDEELLVYLRDTIYEIYTFAHYHDYVYRELKTQPNVAMYDIQGEAKQVYIADESYRKIHEPLHKIPIELYTSFAVITGRPRFFAIDFLNYRLYLYPVPDGEYPLIVFYQVAPPVLQMNDVIVFPDKELLKLGILARAYSKQDADIFDKSALEFYTAKYKERLAIFKNRHVRDRSIPTISPIHRGLL